MKEQRITIRLDEQEHSLLSSLSLRENKTESEIVRAALRKYCQEALASQSSYSLAQELGIIGITEELPSDLSTNKAYFEGFGE
ncbi:MAG: ribbon-helix-helix protein, CopG family [Xenococcaceae cyanobacterium]